VSRPGGLFTARADEGERIQTSESRRPVTEPAQLRALGAGQFQIRSWKGMSFDVQASANLTDWISVATVTNLDGTLKFQDPSTISHPLTRLRSGRRIDQAEHPRAVLFLITGVELRIIGFFVADHPKHDLE
jgi:hypothetical protein